MTLPIAGPIQLALSFYELDLEITDRVYVTSDGEDVLVPLAVRSIKGAVDPSRSRQMERLFGGSVSDGDIAIYTTAELYFADMYDADEETQRQSFTVYQGVPYRIAEVADWLPQVGIRVYLGKRHVEQQEVTDGGSSA